MTHRYMYEAMGAASNVTDNIRLLHRFWNLHTPDGRAAIPVNSGGKSHHHGANLVVRRALSCQS